MKIYFNLMIFLLIVSCKNKPTEYKEKGNLILTSSFFSSNSLLNSLSQKFIDSIQCSDCINELYIDRTFEGKTNITFVARTYYKEYFIRNKPIFYFSIKGNKIFVYTGAEDFLIGNQKYSNDLNFTESKNPIFFRMAYEIINMDSIKLLKVAGQQFTPPPNQEILLPPPASENRKW